MIRKASSLHEGEAWPAAMPSREEGAKQPERRQILRRAPSLQMEPVARTAPSNLSFGDTKFWFGYPLVHGYPVKKM